MRLYETLVRTRGRAGRMKKKVMSVSQPITVEPSNLEGHGQDKR